LDPGKLLDRFFDMVIAITGTLIGVAVRLTSQIKG